MIEQLAEYGWALLHNVETTSHMMTIAERLGRPLRAPGGQVVKVLSPTDSVRARNGSLSATWGRDAFPFHTDTAFWPTPARYLLMRVVGDRRRNTNVLPFDLLWSSLACQSRVDAERSVWRTGADRGSIYCSMSFAASGTRGWRYDAAVMTPVNTAALRVRDRLAQACEDSRLGVSVPWQSTGCLVVDNWRVLHARGPQPEQEGARLMFRIYVG